MHSQRLSIACSTNMLKCAIVKTIETIPFCLLITLGMKELYTCNVTKQSIYDSRIT